MFARWSIIQTCLRQVRIHQVPPTKAWQCVVSWCLLNHVACVLSKSITCTQLAMRFLQLRIFIEVSFLLKQHKYTKRIKKVWLCFSDPFFWGSKIEIKHTKIIKTNHLSGHPDIGNHGLCHGLTVDDGLHLDYGNLQGTRQPTNQGFVKYNKKLLWNEKQNDTPNLKSLLLSDSILHSFNYLFFSLFFVPTSLLLFLLLYRAPTFLLLPAFGLLLIPIISGAFPLEPSMNLNDALPNLQASKEPTKRQTCSCSRCYNHWIIDHYSDHMNCKTIQPKQCTMHYAFLELKNFQPFPDKFRWLLPPPLCEQVGPSVGPSFGPVCHRSWDQMLLCTTLKLCHIWIYHQYITFTS